VVVLVLPVHDVNPLCRTPWVTYGLVAAHPGVPYLELEGKKVPVADSEFADVPVEVDTTANEPRLRQLLDPSADRWRDA